MPDYLSLFRSFITHRHEVHFAYEATTARLVYVNEAYEHLIGRPVAQVHEELPSLLAAVHVDDAQYLRQRLARAATDEVVEDVEVRLERGERRQWLRVSAQWVASPEGPTYLVGAVRDITADKEAAINAQKFNTKKDSTLEILSHDLAGPLALMQQLAEQLEWEVPASSAKARELLDLMQRTCQQGIALIRDFVDHEFLESASVELKRERADLSDWLRIIMAEYEQSTPLTHLHFHFVPLDEPLYASVDVNKLQQVVNNLVSNAIKFTPDDGHITVRLERCDGHARIIVADTGVGIPAALQPELFERFTKSRRPGLRGEQTTGLGMSVMRTIVGLHDGRIWVDSAEGQGTTVHVEVPALLV
jgi:two-component system sensor histidine kinase VicK